MTTAYGPADVLEIAEIAAPEVRDHEVLVRVHAAPVTVGDLRLRAADFPSISAWPGRLVVGVMRPRRPVQGTMFAGRVVAIGPAVTRYAVGDEVFGNAMHGTYAEHLAIEETGAMARIPRGVGFAEMASVPYGGVTALRFLRDVARVTPGERVLVVGASGGVGRLAVQIAKHLGAHVTGVCSRRSFDLVRALGADALIDHASEDFTRSDARYDVIFDVADATSFGRCRRALTPTGRYTTLMISVRVLLEVALTALLPGPKAKFGIAMGTREDMEALADLVGRGLLRPVVAERFPLDRIADAHRAAEQRPLGAVVVTPSPEDDAPPTTERAPRPALVGLAALSAPR